MVKTPAARPKVVLFALLMTSSSVSNSRQAATLPKISSCTNLMSSRQLVTTAGERYLRGQHR